MPKQTEDKQRVTKERSVSTPGGETNVRQVEELDKQVSQDRERQEEARGAHQEQQEQQ